MQSSGKIGLPAVLIVAVCAIVAATYWPALSAKALSIDDQQYLMDNVLVKNPGWTSAKRFITEILEPSTVGGYYQPLTMISLMLDYAAGGRADNLRVFHVTSLALHTVNTALVIVLLYLLFGNIWAAAAAGLLFGVHPMTVEPIPWVGERKTLLAAFFALWSLVFYVRYSSSGGRKLYLGCFLTYLLALMSKPTSTPLPMVMLLMDYWPLKKLSKKAFLEKLPLFALGGISAVIAYISQHRTAATILPTKFGWGYVPEVLCHNIIFYLYKIIWPVNLSSHYAFPKTIGLSNPMILAGVIGTCVLLSLLIFSLRWTRAALTGWLIFFAAILPTMQVIGFSNVIASDKFAYLPSIGLLMIITTFLTWLGKGSKIKVMTAVIVLTVAGAEAFATQQYLVYWKDSLSLANHMLKLTPDDATLYCHRGNIYWQIKGDYDHAISDYDRAIAINPRYVSVYISRGTTYAQGKGDLDRAIADYSMAIEINPRYAEAYNNRGNAYKDKGQYALALADFNKALEIKPGLAEAYNNRGTIYKRKGEYDRAISDYNKALAINQGLVETYNNRGNIYLIQGKYDLAISDYSKAIEINPRDAETYNNRGNAYAATGELDFAIADYGRAIKINPQDANAYNSRGNAYKNEGELDRAIADYSKAIEINPAEAQAYNNRGNTYKRKGFLDRAISDYDTALKINPKYAEVYYNRGSAYAQGKGEYDRAITDYSKAIEIDPNLVVAYNNRGIAYKDKGEPDQAISDYNKAIAIHPGFVEAYINRGAAYHSKGEYDRAIADYNKALEINPKYPDAWLDKAIAYEAAGRLKEAAAAYKAFVQYAPAQYGPFIEKAKQKIKELER